ncbi:MAG TPA: hypothetical protein VGG48_20415 [Rhizomicrobium sp.]|jgi:hypothetical protein
MTRFLGLALVLSLAGCDTIGTTVGNLRYDVAAGSFSDKTTSVMSACRARVLDHSLDPIRQDAELLKEPPDGPVRFGIETNTGKATDAERHTIRLWAAAIQQCQGDALAVLNNMAVPPGATRAEMVKVRSYITDAWSAGNDLRVRLYNGEIGYADYGSERLKLAQDALQTARRYAQDMDEENSTQDLENAATSLEPYLSLL